MLSHMQTHTHLTHTCTHELTHTPLTHTPHTHTHEHTHEHSLTHTNTLSHMHTPTYARVQVGAQVVLLINDRTRGLVNGSRGLVVDFRAAPNSKLDPPVLPVVKFDNNVTMCIRPHLFDFTVNGQTKRGLQLPLNLAWAITVHKSQGMSISRLEVDICNCFAPGQAYTALSRARDIDNLWIKGRLPSKFKTSHNVIRFFGGKWCRVFPCSCFSFSNFAFQ